MTMTEQTPRRNAEGDPCPSWCVTDHDRLGRHGHSSSTAGVAVPGKVPGLDDELLVSGYQYAGDEPEVMIAALRYGPRDDPDPDMVLDLRLAGRLAGLIEMLAGATPEHHGQLAAAIRSAIAVVTDTTTDLSEETR